MNLKQTIDIDIESNGVNGEGIARVDGKVVFVPFTLKGERVRAVVKCVKRKYAQADVIKVLSSSPYRKTPDCAQYFKCGGCDTCHIDDGYRKQTLVSELKNNLKKIAGIEFESIGFVESDTLMRNKIAMPFGYDKGRVTLGMYRQGTHSFVSVIDSCLLLNPNMRKISGIICDFANEFNIPCYNESTEDGILRHLVMRTVGGRTSATVVINAHDLYNESELYSRLSGVECDLFVSTNTRKTNVIFGDSVRLIGGEPVLKAEVMGVRAELSPQSFFQVNDCIRDKIYKAAIDHIQSDTLIDLYSGIGITSNIAASKCKSVISVELSPQAVKNAVHTAELNGNGKTIDTRCGSVEKIINDITVQDCDVIVDPPRSGCGGNVMRAIAQIHPKNLIYISCNHATMSRDISELITAAPDYSLISCDIYDMFPTTHHVETVVLLSRK